MLPIFVKLVSAVTTVAPHVPALIDGKFLDLIDRFFLLLGLKSLILRLSHPQIRNLLCEFKDQHSQSAVARLSSYCLA